MRKLAKILGACCGAVVLLIGSAAIYVYESATRPTSPVGLEQMSADDPGHQPIPVAIWYPTSASPGFVLIGTRGARLASDGPVLGNSLPLIVISHGTGGSALSHADTAIALAQAGFVVAALTHPGDNLRDSSEVGKPDWLVNRSRQVERVIDAALEKWSGRSHLDSRRIGVFGFSAGATTALITIGGVPDLRKIASQCASHPEFVCQLTNPSSYRNASPEKWRADPRIEAAVIAAPGLGFTFAPDGLSNVRAPVQLWSGSEDQTVPFATNTGMVESLLPEQPEVHVVPGATHLSFLMPCGLIGPPQLCGDPKGFDRAQFHREFNAAVVRFFRTHLTSPGRS